MKKVKNLIIGFGKGGKTLAAKLASAGESTMIVEQSELMFGGTCINVACIPTKALEFSSRLSSRQGGDFDEKAKRYSEAVAQKSKLTALLRQKNYDKAVGAGVEVVVGTASFVDSTHLSVTLSDGTSETVEAERIFINTGARPFVPPIPGINESRFVYLSEGLLSLDRLPRRMVIIGGGYIGLEFASFYNNFGSEITIIQDGDRFLPREDSEIAGKVLENLQSRGIKVLFNTKTLGIKDEADSATLTLSTPDGETQLSAEAVLVATGRRPNVESLNLGAAGVELTERGGIITDEHLRTSVSGIYALGDVVGGLQFTYISLDDSRIVLSSLTGDGSRTTANRGSVPYSVFIDPPFSRIGLSEEDAVKAGLNIKIARLAAAAVPKAHVLREQAGMLKAVVDADTDLILGAHFFAVDSHEMINIIKLAMDSKIKYTVLRDMIFTHPTMSESLNDLFLAVK